MATSAARRSAAASLAGALALLLSAGSAELHATGPQQPGSGAAAAARSPQRALLDRYCVTCHNERLNTAGLTLDLLDVDDVAARPEVWEKVVRKLRAGLMPPMGRPRPDREAYDGFAGWLEARLDRAAALDPDPGRAPVFHRLNRAEYANAIRDLLAVEIDATELLPADDASYGFDNIAASLRMSPTLVDRYLAAARKISRAAVGSSAAPPAVQVYHLPPDLPQERHLEGLPLGTRGGTRVRHHFPKDGEYVIQAKLALDIADNIPRYDETHELEVLLDGQPVARFTFAGEPDPDGEPEEGAALRAGTNTAEQSGYRRNLDAHWRVRLPVTGGLHEVAAAFVENGQLLTEATRTNTFARLRLALVEPSVRAYAGGYFNDETRSGPYLAHLTVTGPFVPSGPGDTASRRRIFTCRPAAPEEEEACAARILATLARRAYRRPPTDAELDRLLAAYRDGRHAATFDAGAASDAGAGFDAGAASDARAGADAGAGFDAGAGLDAGARPYAGAGFDAGAGLDAGARPYAGAGFDAEARSDAGTGFDAGARFDAGAGAGAGPRSDAGAKFDAGAGLHAAAGFDAGIERALRQLLVAPGFLYRIEERPRDVAPDTNYPVSDLDLASRLSFFLWSSIPDDELLDVAERGRLRDPAVLDRQVRRMLADRRSEAFVTNFTGQWLNLRRLPDVAPDLKRFPDFDGTLRHALRRETELFFESILREDRSVLELLTAGHTFVNERLAAHYGIPAVQGSHFRRVTLGDTSRRGLLGKGSILAATSYAHRTSPVLRGKWILENLLGTPPPPPPPDVPDLKEDNDRGEVLSMRDRMVQHRANPVCASCHAMMDPLGLALENFDAIGQWRTRSEAFTPIDASGAMLDGTTFDGVDGLREVLLDRSELFVTTLTEKLLTYALGRGLDAGDAPVVRRIVRAAAAEDYRFQALLMGIVKSLPFQMRRSSGPPTAASAQ